MSHPYAPVRKLLPTDQVDTFDCGSPPLNLFLQRYALVNQKANSAQTYVCCQADKVAGFYSLAVGSVTLEDAPHRVTKGLARHPVPVMILARLAVDMTHQRKGLGQALLKDALLRTAQAADIAGIRCLLVHAKDDAARRWYEIRPIDVPPVTGFINYFATSREPCFVDSDIDRAPLLTHTPQNDKLVTWPLRPKVEVWAVQHCTGQRTSQLEWEQNGQRLKAVH